MGTANGKEGNEQQGARFATAVRPPQQGVKDGADRENAVLAGSLGDEIERVVAGSGCLPVPAGKPKGKRNGEKQGSGSEEAFGHGW